MKHQVVIWLFLEKVLKWYSFGPFKGLPVLLEKKNKNIYCQSCLVALNTSKLYFPTG